MAGPSLPVLDLITYSSFNSTIWNLLQIILKFYYKMQLLFCFKIWQNKIVSKHFCWFIVKCIRPDKNSNNNSNNKNKKWAKLTKRWRRQLLLCVIANLCYYHVMYAFQSESTLYSCLKLLARNRRDIWSLSDNNGIRTNNHLFCKRTLNHLPELAVKLEKHCCSYYSR